MDIQGNVWAQGEEHLLGMLFLKDEKWKTWILLELN